MNWLSVTGLVHRDLEGKVGCASGAPSRRGWSATYHGANATYRLTDQPVTCRKCLLMLAAEDSRKENP